MEAIESEVKKLIDSDFVREEQHPDWVANIADVPKKNRKIRICIDYRDLNVACPKVKFSLPITDVMIDNTCGFKRMSFMDDFSGHNQIKIYPDDEKTHIFQDVFRSILLHSNALWLEECRCNLSTRHECNLPQAHT